MLEYNHESSKLAASFQKGTETPPQTASLKASKKKKKPLKKVSTKPFSTKGFRLLWPYRNREQWQYNTKSNHNLLNYLQQKT